MSDGISLHLEAEDLLREVRKMERRVQKRILLRVLRRVGRIMVIEAKKRAPVGELNDGFHEKGNLRRSIGMKSLTRLGLDNLAVLVGPRVRGGRNAKGYHGAMVEKGTKPHLIKTKSQRFYKHKGSKAQNYLEMAFIITKTIAEQEYRKALEDILYG